MDLEPDAQATTARPGLLARLPAITPAILRTIPLAIPLAISLLLAGPAAASGTLEFDAGGHTVAMEVGDDAAPVLARVRYFAPGDAAGIALRPQDVRVDAFDTGRRRLQLRHHAPGGGAPSFELHVEGERGVLQIGGQRLRAPFDWQL